MFLSFALSSALAAASTNCQATLACKLKDRAFMLEFRSPSGECAEDDGELLLNGKSLAIKPGWIDELRAFGNGTSLCDSKDVPPPAVYAVAADRALVFYWRSGRPQLDWMGVALLDLKSGRLLHEIERLGEIKERVILKTKRGFRIRLVREHLKEVACDCAAAAVEDWLEVYVQGDKLKTSWGR